MNAGWNEGNDFRIELVCNLNPVRVLNKRTKQPGTVDFRVCIHAEDTDKPFAFVRHSEAIARWNETFCQGRANIRLSLPEESDVMLHVAVRRETKLISSSS